MKSVSIFDPVCGSLRGHPYATIISYAKWFHAYGFGRIAIHTAAPSIKNDSDFNLSTDIPWIYNYYLPRKGVGSPTHRLVQYFAKKTTECGGLTSRARRPLFLCAHALAVKAITKALRSVLEAEDNLVFCPGTDIYTILALLRLQGFLSKRKTRPRIVLRFMGVMENAGYFKGSHEVAIKSLQHLVHFQRAIRVTAETEVYAAYLEKMLRIRVPVTGIPHKQQPEYYPSKSIAQAIKNSNKHNIVAVMGSARADKGYLRLVELARALEFKTTNNAILLYQRMDASRPEYCSKYEDSLCRTKNTLMLPPQLTDNDYHAVLRQSSVTLLPYEPTTYRYRGSSVLFDSLAYERPLLARAGTGFAHTVSAEGLGVTFSDATSFAEGVAKLLNNSLEANTTIVRNGQKYLKQLDVNLAQVVIAETQDEDRVY